jgi:hypothetical protein
LKGPPGYGTAFRDPRNGGECWVCPLQLVRSTAPVYSREIGAGAACVAGGNTDRLVYQLGQYPESSLYRFMPGLLEMALAKPKAVDAFLSKRAGGNAQKKRALWTNMINDPAGSAELKALMFASLLDVAKQDNPNVVAKASLNEFERYMRARRVYIATEAVRMYQGWDQIDGYNMTQAARNASGIGGISTAVIGAGAADYKSYAWSGAVPDSAGIAFVLASESLSQLTGSTSAGNVVNDALFEFSTSYLEPVTKAIEKSLDALQDVAEEMLGDAKTFTQMADAAMVLKGADAAAVGLTLVTGAMEISNGIMTLLEKDKQAAEYGSYIQEMDRPITVRQLLDSPNPDDKQLLMLMWALGTEAYRPSDKIGTGRLAGGDLCMSSGWMNQQCAIASEKIKAAAKAVGY